MNNEALSFGLRAVRVRVERGSVHASDDATFRQIALPPCSTMRALVMLATADAFLPGISGGLATWVVESSGAAGTVRGPIAVRAQQWREPVFLVSATTSVAANFGAAVPSLYFRYRCQDDPSAVLAELAAGTATGLSK